MWFFSARKTYHGAHDLPSPALGLYGGRPSLDFVNTRRNRGAGGTAEPETAWPKGTARPSTAEPADLAAGWPRPG